MGTSTTLRKLVLTAMLCIGYVTSTHSQESVIEERGPSWFIDLGLHRRVGFDESIVFIGEKVGPGTSTTTISYGYGFVRVQCSALTLISIPGGILILGGLAIYVIVSRSRAERTTR